MEEATVEETKVQANEAQTPEQAEEEVQEKRAPQYPTRAATTSDETTGKAGREVLWHYLYYVSIGFLFSFIVLFLYDLFVFSTGGWRDEGLYSFIAGNVVIIGVWGMTAAYVLYEFWKNNETLALAASTPTTLREMLPLQDEEAVRFWQEHLRQDREYLERKPLVVPNPLGRKRSEIISQSQKDETDENASKEASKHETRWRTLRWKTRLAYFAVVNLKGMAATAGWMLGLAVSLAIFASSRLPDFSTAPTEAARTVRLVWVAFIILVGLVVGLWKAYDDLFDEVGIVAISMLMDRVFADEAKNGWSATPYDGMVEKSADFTFKDILHWFMEKTWVRFLFQMFPAYAISYFLLYVRVLFFVQVSWIIYALCDLFHCGNVSHYSLSYYIVRTILAVFTLVLIQAMSHILASSIQDDLRPLFQAISEDAAAKESAFIFPLVSKEAVPSTPTANEHEEDGAGDEDDRLEPDEET